MSGLVEKVKEVVRSRSKHRSIDLSRPRNSADQLDTTSEAASSRRSMQEGRRGRDPGAYAPNSLDGTTKSFGAMNMDDSSSAAPSSNPPDMPLPPLPTNSRQNIESARAQTQPSNAQYQEQRPINGTAMTPTTPTHQRNVSGNGYPNQDMSSEIVSDSGSSMRRKPLPSLRNDVDSATSTGRADVDHPQGPRSLPGHKHARSTDVAPNDQSRLVPHFMTRSPAGDSGVTGETHHKDLRLPATFDLSNTEHTYVETNVVPAVVQENVHINRTELVTKAIHRDIHIDHHYTYVQPIPVLEILPARHFRLDSITGVKTEIPAPPGYKLPAHLEPRRAEDYGHLRQTTRHYVVDEQHPHGRLENLPRGQGHDEPSFHVQRNGYRGAATRV